MKTLNTAYHYDHIYKVGTLPKFNNTNTQITYKGHVVKYLSAYHFFHSEKDADNYIESIRTILNHQYYMKNKAVLQYKYSEKENRDIKNLYLKQNLKL